MDNRVGKLRQFANWVLSTHRFDVMTLKSELDPVRGGEDNLASSIDIEGFCTVNFNFRFRDQTGEKSSGEAAVQEHDLLSCTRLLHPLPDEGGRHCRGFNVIDIGI